MDWLGLIAGCGSLSRTPREAPRIKDLRIFRCLDIKIVTSDSHNKDIRLDDQLVMRMKYPSINEFIKSNSTPRNTRCTN